MRDQLINFSICLCRFNSTKIN